MDECEKCIFENENFVVALDEMDLIEMAIDSFDEEIAARTKKYVHDKMDDMLKLGNVLNIYGLEVESNY